MSDLHRRTLLTWFDKKSLNHLVGMKEIGKTSVDQFLPRLKGYSFISGVYPILKEEEVAKYTLPDLDFEQYDYLLVFLPKEAPALLA